MDPSANEQLQRESSEARENEHLVEATKSLRLHLGLADTPGEKSTARPPSPQPLFWIEVAPPSARGAKCQLHCSKNIMPGQYRIAVNPGQYGYYGNENSGTLNRHSVMSNIVSLIHQQQITTTSTALRRLPISPRPTTWIAPNHSLDAIHS